MKRLCLSALMALAPTWALAFGGAAAPAPSSSAGGSPMYVHLTQSDGKQVKAALFAESSASIPVASVGDGAITVQDLSKAIAGAHETFAAEAKAGGKNFAPILERLIDVRLLLLEARDMGLYELPEITRSTAEFRTTNALATLKARVTKDIGFDALEVEQQYRDATKEWKVHSVLFPKQEDALAMKGQVDAGKSYDDLVKVVVAAKKAKGGEPAEFLPRSRLLPAILAAVSSMKAGDVSAPVKVPDGYAVLQVEEVRYRDDPKAREEAETRSRTARQKAALAKYYAGLLKRYASIDKALLAKLDFEAKKPGMKALLKDQRGVARVRGAKSVTVADLAKALDEQFYHGVDVGIREKKVNKQKAASLDALLSQRLVPLEAERLGITRSAEYRKQVADFTDSAVFTAFVSKVILPDIKVADEDVAMYYAQHKGEFMYPAFYKVESIGFAKVKDAQAALTKLRSGTDYKWFKSNADGQLKDGESEVQFDGSTVAASAMPKDLAKLMETTKPGDYRLYSSSDNHAHVIHVLEATPPAPQALDDVKQSIHDKVFAERATKSIRDWAEKLRKAHPVTVYITKIGA
jgi:parvulin-like peptidyl-prolyl isomerase